MKRSIYEIQNPKDYEPYFTENKFQENLIQALANMGQRLGLKGDGIKYNSFTFKDLLNNDAEVNDNLSNDNSDRIGFICLNSEGNINIGIASKNLNYNTDKNMIETNALVLNNYGNINDRLFLDNEFTLEIPVNNIEKYINQSIISNDSKYFTQIMVGKYFGYDEDDENGCEYIYNKFDIDTNKLLYAYRIFHVKETNTSDYYCLLKLQYVGENKDYINKATNYYYDYMLTLQIFDTNYLTKDSARRLKNSFIYKYICDNSKNKFNFLDKRYIDINELEYFNENDINSNSIVSLILNHPDNKYDYNPYIINYCYNTNDDVFFFASNKDTYNQMISNIAEKYGILMTERMNFIVNDIVVNYVNFMNLFNDKYYFANRRTLLLKILFSIYNKIDMMNNDGYAVNDHNYMYIPLDYKFHYISNSENEMEIYYSTNIFVNIMNLYNESDIRKILDGENIIYAYKGENKVKVYNFEIEYNTKYENIINKIQIKDLYTLPYINEEYNWCINDKDTNTSALGRDAGNPNIIITYSSNKSTDSDDSNNSKYYSILNNIYNKDKISLSDWEQKSFKISKDYFRNVEQNPVCYAFIPKITEYNIRYLYDSIIVSISNVNCLENNDYIAAYNGKYIITIWTLSDITNDVNNLLPTYVYLRDKTERDEDFAITFGTISNNVSSSDETTSKFDILLLKAKTNVTAQSVSNDNVNNWLILKNKTHNEYNSELLASQYNYINDLNFVIQYNDTIHNDSGYITYEQRNKYLGYINPNDGSAKVSVTNSAYPKYLISETNNESQDEELITETVEVNNSYLVSKTVITGQETISTDYIEDTINYNVNVYKTNNSSSDNIEKNIELNGTFNEYIFNDNIPNLDLKEILIRNSNTLNRVNILSLDSAGYVYNAYLGSSYNDDPLNRGTFHIGSNNTNINIGSDTLINEESRYNFIKHDTLSLDFDNLKLNTKKSIISNNNIWTKQVCQNKSFYSTDIRPIGTYESYDNSIFAYDNSYLVSLLSPSSSFDNIDNLKQQLLLESSYIYKEINIETTNIVNTLKTNDLILFLLNNKMVKKEEKNADSIFKRINIYTNNDNDVQALNIKDTLSLTYGLLLEKDKYVDVKLTDTTPEELIYDFEKNIPTNVNIKYSYTVNVNQVGNVKINNLGDPIKIDLDNHTISAVHYGACMVVLADKEIKDLQNIDEDVKYVVLFVNVDIQYSRTLYTCLNVNKLFKYKLGKDIDSKTVHINTKFNKLLSYDGYNYLILNNDDNIINIDENIMYYDNELSIMYYEVGDNIYINIGFERDNYTHDNIMPTKFNIIQNTVLNK